MTKEQGEKEEFLLLSHEDGRSQVKWQPIREMVDTMLIGHSLIILDACNSGSASFSAAKLKPWQVEVQIVLLKPSARRRFKPVTESDGITKIEPAKEFERYVLESQKELLARSGRMQLPKDILRARTMLQCLDKWRARTKDVCHAKLSSLPTNNEHNSFRSAHRALSPLPQFARVLDSRPARVMAIAVDEELDLRRRIQQVDRVVVLNPSDHIILHALHKCGMDVELTIDYLIKSIATHNLDSTPPKRQEPNVMLLAATSYRQSALEAGWATFTQRIATSLT